MTTLAVCFLILGIVLLRRGNWPARRGSDPHCRKCDYSLIGITSQRCPECGALLDGKNIVRGLRHRNAGISLAGVALVVLAAAVIAPTISRRLSRVDWYRYKPGSWLIDEVNEKKTSVRAARELMRREASGKLSTSVRMAMVDAILSDQNGQMVPTIRQLLDFAGRQYEAGKLSESQKQKLFTNAIGFGLLVRPTVAPGDRVPFRLHLSKMMPQSWQARVTNLHVSVDGQPQPTNPESDILLPFGGVGGPAETGWAIPFATPGEHQLQVIATYELMDQTGAVVHREERTRIASFKVLEAEPEGYFKLLNDPVRVAQLRAAIKPIAFEFNPNTHRLSGMLELSQVTDAAYEAFALIGNQEVPLTVGFFAERERRLVQPLTSGPISIASQPATVDIVLRSSEPAARRTTDLYQLLNFELIYKNVPVQVRP